jgi:hypothetical protein
MNNEFKRMQELAGITKENEENNTTNPIEFDLGDHEWLISHFKDLAESNKIYNGLSEYLSSNEFIETLKYRHDVLIEMLHDSYGEEEVNNNWEEYEESYWADFEYFFGQELLGGFSDIYMENLLNNGFTYNSDEETWTVPDDQKNNFGGETVVKTDNIVKKFDTSRSVFLDSMASDFMDYYPDDINEKTNTNDEFKRMQELAGIVKEETEHTQFQHRDNK